MLVTLDRRNRILKCERMFGVALKGKASGSGMEEGIGDAVLVDLCSGIVAIADSSDRNTTASRSFLFKFREGVSDTLDGIDLCTMTDEGLNAYVSLLKARIEALLLTISYHDNAAFSGMVLCATASGNRGILFHCGDTRLYLFDRDQGILKQLTKTDSCLIGRISSMSQVDVVDMDGDVRLLLASDGVGDLDRQLLISGGEGLADTIERVLRDSPVEDVPELLMARTEEIKQTEDDICLLAASPSNWAKQGLVLVAGGTTSAEERDFQRVRAAYCPGMIETITWTDGQVLDLARS